MKRTDIDFSNHIINIIKSDNVLIYEFKKPDTKICGVTFINTCGIMSVTGDFGNWIFCREFHPSPFGDGVSDSYWDEKLHIHSQQKSHIFDSDETLKCIEEFKNSFEDYHDRELNEDELDWLENLDNNVFDEIEYKYVAFREKPNTIDYEDVPYGEIRHVQLNAVYDAFDALCNYLKLNNKAESA